MAGRGQRRIVALNIGTRNTVAVQGLVDDAPAGQRTAVVEKVATVETPAGALRESGVYSPQAIVAMLRDLWRTAELQTSDVVVGINSRLVTSGAKWVKRVHPEDLAVLATVEWLNSQQLFGGYQLRPDETVTKYFVLREREVRTGGMSEVEHEMLLMAAAVDRTPIQAMANIVEDAGLELVGMDLTAFAMLRGTRLVPREDSRVVDLLVDVGATFSTLVLHSNGNIRAVRTTSGNAGDDMTSAIADDLRSLSGYAGTLADAEIVKRTLSQAAASGDKSPVTTRALEATRARMGGLAVDITDIVRTYMEAANGRGPSGFEQLEERGLSSITLTGGGAALYGLDRKLAGSRQEGGFDVSVGLGSVAPAFRMVDGGPVKPFVNGVSVVSTVGLLVADLQEEA